MTLLNCDIQNLNVKPFLSSNLFWYYMLFEIYSLNIFIFTYIKWINSLMCHNYWDVCVKGVRYYTYFVLQRNKLYGWIFHLPACLSWECDKIKQFLIISFILVICSEKNSSNPIIIWWVGMMANHQLPWSHSIVN